MKIKPSELFELEKKHISNMWYENLHDSIELGDFYYREADLIKLMERFDKVFISREEPFSLRKKNVHEKETKKDEKC